MNKNQYELNKSIIRASFNKAAHSYEDVAVLQREIGQRMLQRLELIKIKPDTIIDIGAGPGTQTDLLAQRFSDAHSIALDLSINMLQQGKKSAKKAISYVCGDAESLPLANESVDLIFSNLTLQWCSQLDHAFFELQRVLKPGGLLIFSTLGPDTLHELRNSWQSVDNYTHVSAFMDMHDIGDALLRFEYSDPVMDVENIIMTYKDVFGLMGDLKSLGAHNLTAGRPTGLTTRSRLLKMIAGYEQYRKEGVLPATYEVIYGHAWKLDNKTRTKIPRSRPGIVSIPVTELKHVPTTIIKENK